MTNWRERDEVAALGKGGQFWIGGTYNLTSERWTWIDGEIWGVTFWGTEEEKLVNEESGNTKAAIYYSGLWKSYSPKATFPFVCKTLVKIEGVQNRTWKYTADDLKNANKITVQWKYHFPGKDILAKWERPVN